MKPAEGSMRTAPNTERELGMSEQIWRSKSDELLLEAYGRLTEYTEEGQRFIRAELERRGLTKLLQADSADDVDEVDDQLPTLAQLLVPTEHADRTEDDADTTQDDADQTPAAARPGGHAASPDTVVAHWDVLIENLQASSLEFYRSVEAALHRRQVPQTTNTRVEYKEAGLLSARREYLQVKRERLIFDVCAAPFGTGFFVSSWLAEAKPRVNPLVAALSTLGLVGLMTWLLSTAGFMWGTILFAGMVMGGLWLVRRMDDEFLEDVVQSVPLLGAVYLHLFKPPTYYRMDTMFMFQKAVHNAVLEVIDQLTTAKGIRALSEAERKPVMREFYARTAIG